MTLDHQQAAGHKRAWRRWAKLIVKPPAAYISLQVAGHIEAFVDSIEGQVVLYSHLPGEIAVDHLLHRADKERFVLTRSNPGMELSLHPADAPLERHRFGFWQPVAQAPQLDPSSVAMVLVPALLFDRYGTRLGRGAGYYDRFLATIPHAVVVGVARCSTVVGELPVEPHDIAMTHLATEDGVRLVSPRVSSSFT